MLPEASNESGGSQTLNHAPLENSAQSLLSKWRIGIPSDYPESAGMRIHDRSNVVDLTGSEAVTDLVQFYVSISEFFIDTPLNPGPNDDNLLSHEGAFQSRVLRFCHRLAR